MELINFCYYLCNLSFKQKAEQFEFMPYSEEDVYNRFLGCSLIFIWKSSTLVFFLACVFFVTRRLDMLMSNEDLNAAAFVLLAIVGYWILSFIVRKIFKFGFFHGNYNIYKDIEKSFILDILYRITLVSFVVFSMISSILLLESIQYWYLPIMFAYLGLYILNMSIKREVVQNS